MEIIEIDGNSDSKVNNNDMSKIFEANPFSPNVPFLYALKTSKNPMDF